MAHPRCRVCNGKSEQAKGGRYRCTRCRLEWDGDPHEGGTHYTDPSLRLQKEELERARAKLQRLLRA